MTHPDPVRASFEAWAKDAGALAGPTGPQCLELARAGEASEWCYFHARTELAYRVYRAASKVSEVEREYLEASYVHDAWCDSDGVADWNEHARICARLKAAKAALRLHRTPPKVDRVAQASDLLNDAIAASPTMLGKWGPMIRDLLTAELEARGK